MACVLPATEQTLRLRGAEHADPRRIAGVRLWGPDQSDACKKSAGARAAQYPTVGVPCPDRIGARRAVTGVDFASAPVLMACGSAHGFFSAIAGTARTAPTPAARLAEGDEGLRAAVGEEDRQAAAAAAAAATLFARCPVRFSSTPWRANRS
jgi:hypothetical protein